ncbi:MAG: GNAT family N-acetyltransferase [Ornithinibacter sp.]
MTLIRSATALDLAQLAAVEDAADAVFEERFGPTGWPASDTGEDRAAEPGLILVAGDPVLGFAHVLDLGGHWHLDQIAVLPEHGRAGIGSALLDAVHAEVAARGAPRSPSRRMPTCPGTPRSTPATGMPRWGGHCPSTSVTCWRPRSEWAWRGTEPASRCGLCWTLAAGRGGRDVHD